MHELNERNLRAQLIKARTTHEEEHPAVALLYMDLGDYYDLIGQFRDAEREYKRAARIFQELGLDHELLLAIAIKSAAEMARMQNKLEAAKTMKAQARRLVREYCRRDLGHDDPDAA
jgi:tetratricopeptide (TPR) repeat protein